MTIAAGSRLGHYEVLAPLGAGGMGEVYRARDTRLGREVAIKVLPADVSADVERLKRFEKEAQSASSLNHPSIVTIYEIGQSDAVSWIAMELVDGKTLRDLVAAGPLTIRKLLQIGAQVADGLARAHEAGIVHRDLKPENVMVTKDGLAKILDFGLAKLNRAEGKDGTETDLPTQTATSPGTVMGTAGYMSPEQASGRSLDFRSDQFSMGAILYEMAAGKRAFQRKSVVQTLAAIIQEEPEPVGASNPQVPVPLRWIIERCLAKEPEDRYVSTRDLARELATVRDRLAEASMSGAVLAAEPARPGLRIRGAILALALLAALAAGTLASRLVWQARPASHPTLKQVTFRRVGIYWARFAPDGRAIVYGVAQRGPGELFTATPGTPEPRSLGLPPASILSVSSSGELAILVGGDNPNRGTLATVSLAGGAPRELLENVWGAAWTPDGKSLAVVHQVKGLMRVEFPIGKALYEAPGGMIPGIHFSPKGDRIAISRVASWVPGLDEKELIVMDLTGRKSTTMRIPLEFAWSPWSDEIWFNEIEGGVTTIRAVSLSGRKRFVASFAGDFALHDVSRDGHALLERVSEQQEIVGRISGQPAERNLSWLDGSVAVDLSSDGALLLFRETGQGGGPNKAVYKRKTDGSPAVRLGEGRAFALSPDGLWALAAPSADGSSLVLLPTGAGQPRTLTLQGIRLVGNGACFFPDGKRILLPARDSRGERRLYDFDIASGQARAITPAGIGPLMAFSLSPDGRSVVCSNEKGADIYDVAGGPPRPVPGLAAGLFPIKWAADGRSLFVGAEGLNPFRVYRLDLSSGRMELWKEFPFSDIGENGDAYVIPTPDGKSYVYGYTRSFADLFVAEGLK